MLDSSSSSSAAAGSAATALSASVRANPKLRKRAITALRVLSNAMVDQSLPHDATVVAAPPGAFVGVAAKRMSYDGKFEAIAGVAGAGIGAFQASTVVDAEILRNGAGTTAFVGMQFDAIEAENAKRRSAGNVLESPVTNTTYGSSPTSANVSALLEIKNATGHTINLRSGVRSEPLTFSLKRDDGWQASGLFNRSSQCVLARGLTSKYSSDGCIALPNPAPKGIDLRFRQSFLTGESMPLSNAWEIVPPAGSAVHPLLTPPKGVAVFGNVKVCEDTVSNDGYRVFLGRGLCPLLLRDKTGNCSWSNENQTFAGPGCVYRDVVECACMQHGKAAEPEPEPEPLVMSAQFHFPRRVTTITTQEMFFSAESLKHITTLIITVVSIFVFAVISAVYLEMHTRRARRHLVLETVQSEAATLAGFIQDQNGAWTWTFAPDTNDDDGDWGKVRV